MEGFRPQTAREALLEIRRFAGPTQARDGLEYVDAIAEAGLNCSGLENFELSDQLADLLAEAHKLLREVRETEMASMGGRIDEALALPPDLEAMVERRIGR